LLLLSRGFHELIFFPFNPQVRPQTKFTFKNKNKNNNTR